MDFSIKRIDWYKKNKRLQREVDVYRWYNDKNNTIIKL